MEITTTYMIKDCVETLLWDIWYITAITVYTYWIKYCVWCNEDKDIWVYDWQIKWKREDDRKDNFVCDEMDPDLYN